METSEVLKCVKCIIGYNNYENHMIIAWFSHEIRMIYMYYPFAWYPHDFHTIFIWKGNRMTIFPLYCPNNSRMTSSERFVNIIWKTQDFYYPINSTRINYNYIIELSQSWIYLSGGDYTVLYKAPKLSNGLRANGSFNITVRRK